MFIPSTFTIVLLVFSVSSNNALTFIKDQRIHMLSAPTNLRYKSGLLLVSRQNAIKRHFNGVLLAGR